jgi:glycerol-3-phosphate acyltransferase PlsY
MFFEAGAIIVAYLLGSLPTAYIVAKLRKGIDIREVGVGNMGGGNVIREIGVWEGAVVLIVDMGKGAAAIIIAQTLGLSQFWVFGAGFAAILGHSFPVYLGFKGGQGVATLMGVFFILSPLAMSITTGLIGLLLFFVRDFFSAVAIASPVFLVLIWYIDGSTTSFFYALFLTLFIIFRNRRRLPELKVTTSRALREVKALTDKVRAK